MTRAKGVDKTDQTADKPADKPAEKIVVQADEKDVKQEQPKVHVIKQAEFVGPKQNVIIAPKYDLKRSPEVLRKFRRRLVISKFKKEQKILLSVMDRRGENNEVCVRSVRGVIQDLPRLQRGLQGQFNIPPELVTITEFETMIETVKDTSKEPASDTKNADKT